MTIFRHFYLFCMVHWLPITLALPNIATVLRVTVDAGEKAIHHYLMKQKHIPTKIWRLIQENQELFPETATHLKELAMHIFLTACGNYICRYHQKDQAHNQYDGLDGEYIIKGVGYMKKVSKSSNTTDPDEGHMHCGCAIDDVLMEFLSLVRSSCNNCKKTATQPNPNW